jgi:hypothetical protein
MKEITVKAVITLLIDYLIQHHGPPSAIILDRGP